MTDLTFLPASELATLIKSKEVSPVEVIKQTVNRIDKLNPIINAYITTLNEQALQEAKKAEDDIMNGKYKGPLHGIPIGIKDNYSTAGIRTTAGTKILADHVPEENATTVDKLLGAGGIMVGKLNLHQLGAGSTGLNPFYGAARNPWNTNHMTGGSSSGSAASLASGLAAITTGTDTWGSNRIPAAMCGVYGLKPTYGLVSTYKLIPTTYSLDHPGPYARSVADVALGLNTMSGHDPKDPNSLDVPVPDYTADLNKGINGIKIGVPTYYTENLDPDIEKLFNNAIETLKSLGAEVKEIEIPELSKTTFAGYVTATVEGAAINEAALKSNPEAYADDARAFFLAGASTDAPQYIVAQQERRKLAQAFKKAFKDVDVVLGPTVPFTTPAFKDDWVTQNLEVVRHGLPFTIPANLTGIPSFSVPMGLCSKGLPAGMQIMGDHLSERLLLQVGKAWESTGPLPIGYNELEVNKQD